MIKRIGSQTRENIEDTEYTVDSIEGTEIGGRNVFLTTIDGKYELWTERDDFAGYVVVIDGIGYEFVRSL